MEPITLSLYAGVNTLPLPEVVEGEILQSSVVNNAMVGYVQEEVGGGLVNNQLNFTSLMLDYSPNTGRHYRKAKVSLEAC